MKCPRCEGKLRVIDSVNAPLNEIYRRRRCVACGHEFYTVEFEAIVDEKFKKYWSIYHRDGHRKKEELRNG